MNDLLRGHTVSMWNLVFKTAAVFFLLLLLMRLLGKRQLGELELSELVVSILAADLASVPLQNPDLHLLYGLIPVFVLFLCEFLLSWLTMKSVRLRVLLCGKPCFLIRDGEICQEAMRKCRLTVDELTEELRSRDVTDPSVVQYAVLETDGSLNVIQYPDQRPVTAGQMNLSPVDEGYATVLIEDGRLLRDNLRAAGKDTAWLKKELQRRGCANVGQVYVMILFRSGKIYFAEKERRNR